MSSAVSPSLELGADEARIPEVADTTSERMNAMMCSAVVNSIGLLLDIVGVVLMFRFGLPPDVTRTGAGYLTWGVDEGEVRKSKLYDRMSWVALALLILGYGLQIASNWM